EIARRRVAVLGARSLAVALLPLAQATLPLLHRPPRLGIPRLRPRRSYARDDGDDHDERADGEGARGAVGPSETRVVRVAGGERSYTRLGRRSYRGRGGPAAPLAPRRD